MKKSSFLSAIALVLLISSSSFAQPGYRTGPAQQSPDYRRDNSTPASPVVIVDADGRRGNFQDHKYDRYDVQKNLDRRQRKRIEKRYGYVPPLVIFVPDRFVNRAGDYLYNNLFVYHKSRDGYFHLDSRYYNDRWDDYSSNNDRNDRKWDNNRNRY